MSWAGVNLASLELTGKFADAWRMPPGRLGGFQAKPSDRVNRRRLGLLEQRFGGRELLLELLEEVNGEKRRYGFATGAEVGRQPTEQYSALLYDKDTVQIDPSTVYSVTDDKGRFLFEVDLDPLLAGSEFGVGAVGAVLVTVADHIEVADNRRGIA